MGFFSGTIGVTNTYFTEDGFKSATRAEAESHIRELLLKDYFHNKFPTFSEDAINCLIKALMQDKDVINDFLFGSVERVCREYRNDEDDEEENEDDETEEDC